MKFNRCPNCGSKGFYKAKEGTLFYKKATHRCKYCDMEFEKTIRKGEDVWKGIVPAFVSDSQEPAGGDK